MKNCRLKIGREAIRKAGRKHLGEPKISCFDVIEQLRAEARLEGIPIKPLRKEEKAFKPSQKPKKSKKGAHNIALKGKSRSKKGRKLLKVAIKHA